jgi:hypothetical protein
MFDDFRLSRTQSRTCEELQWCLYECPVRHVRSCICVCTSVRSVTWGVEFVFVRVSSLSTRGAEFVFVRVSGPSREELHLCLYECPVYQHEELNLYLYECPVRHVRSCNCVCTSVRSVTWRAIFVFARVSSPSTRGAAFVFVLVSGPSCEELHLCLCKCPVRHVRSCICVCTSVRSVTWGAVFVSERVSGPYEPVPSSPVFPKYLMRFCKYLFYDLCHQTVRRG